MRRYWLDKNHVQGDLVQITGDSFHHICEVCRMDVGSRFEVLTAEGVAYFVELTKIERKQAWASIQDTRKIPQLPQPYLHLAVSVPKLQRMDEIVEKAVEMGVRSIVPFVSDYSFIRKLGEPLASKLERWTRIVQAATQQCGRGELMEIVAPMKLKDLLQDVNQKTGHQGLFPYEGEAQLSARDAILRVKAHNPTDVWAFVGSEGGFSDAEVELFMQNGMKPFSLGQQVLRVETACTAVVSILKYELDLMR